MHLFQINFIQNMPCSSFIIINPLIANAVFSSNFHPLKAVPHSRDPSNFHPFQTVLADAINSFK